MAGSINDMPGFHHKRIYVEPAYFNRRPVKYPSRDPVDAHHAADPHAPPFPGSGKMVTGDKA